MYVCVYIYIYKQYLCLSLSLYVYIIGLYHIHTGPGTMHVGTNGTRPLQTGCVVRCCCYDNEYDYYSD